MHKWEEIIPEKERAIYKKAGFVKGELSLGGNIALLIIDVLKRQVKSNNAKIQTDHPMACSVENEITNIAALLKVCREKDIGIVFIVPLDVPQGGKAKYFGPTTTRPQTAYDPQYNLIVDEIAPQEDELIIKKTKASAFFETPLRSYLYRQKIDTLLVTGCTTSGCVRATVTDGFSSGFEVVVVEDGVFDRAEIPHLVNLFDMNSKYATVVSTKKVIEILTHKY